MRKLTPFQAKLLAEFCSDIAKGALLSALGFSVVAPTSILLRVKLLINGVIIAIGFLYWALEVGKEVELK